MRMKNFTGSSACQSRAHCGACRDREGGRTWREGLAAAFVLPADAPDFACPHGVAWGFVRPPLPIVELTDEEVEEERRRLAAGGCCGEPANA